MDRRDFLGTMAGGLFATRGDAASETAMKGVRARVNFTGKVKGVNLTSKPGAPSERAYWVEWDWSGWIRPQIDCAIALGANAVRILGDVAMVLNRSITQGAYNARLQQLMDYCAGNRVALYYTGCSPQDTNGGDNGTIAAYKADPRAFIDVLASNIRAVTSGATDYASWIIGCDLVQEANAWGNPAAIHAIYGALRPLIPPKIPCTFSVSERLQDTQWIASIAQSCDCIDYHLYPQLYMGTSEPTTAALGALRARYPDRDIVFGEGGIDTGRYSAAEVEAWIRGLIAIADSPESRGALLWAAQDQDQRYGAFDSAWYPRPSIAGPWLKWCRLPYLSVQRGLPPAPTFLPGAPSRSGTTIPPAPTINTGGNVWTLGAPARYGREVLLNGAPAAGGQATLLCWKDEKIKVRNSLDAWLLWTGDRWIATDPP